MSGGGTGNGSDDGAVRGRSVRRRVALVLIAVLVAAVGVAVAFRDRIDPLVASLSGGDGGIDETRASEGPAAATAVPVTVMTVEPGRISEVLRAVGSLSAAQEVDVTVSSAGFIEALSVNEGGRVRKGDVMLTLDAESAAAAVADAKAQLRLNQQRYERQKGLADQGFGARKDLEEAQAALESSRASVARTDRAMEERRLLAPFDGVIGRINYSVGAFVSSSNVITKLRSMEVLYVDFRVPESEASRIGLGDVFDVISADAESRIGQGVTSFVSSDIDRATRSVMIRGEIPNPDMRLRSGQFVSVALALEEKSDAVVLPLDAVVFALSGIYVFRVRDGKAERVPVKIGIETEGNAEILSGIEIGDVVITEGRNQVRHGASVRVVGS